MKRKLKMMLLTIALLLFLGAIGITLFLNLAPQFGAEKKAIRTVKVLASPNYDDGMFENQEKTVTMTDFKLSSFFKFFSNGDNRVPDFPVPVEKINAGEIRKVKDTNIRITWFGHSTILMETAGKAILIDPMFGKAPAPIDWAGPPVSAANCPSKPRIFPSSMPY